MFVCVFEGVGFCAHNFQMDRQTCTRLSAKFGHEPKHSRLTVQANLQKGGVAEGTKTGITSISTICRRLYSVSVTL